MKTTTFIVCVLLLAMLNLSYGQNSAPAPGVITYKTSGIINKTYTPPPPNWDLKPQTADFIVDLAYRSPSGI